MLARQLTATGQSVILSVPVVVIAFAVSPIIALIQELPVVYTLTVGAHALAMPFKQVLAKTMAGANRAGAFTAILVAAIPLQLAGMPMALWALIAGTAVVTLSSERARRHWRNVWAIIATTVDRAEPTHDAQ
jgi:predicted benzoate:H+ symporter BenE